MDTRVGGMGQTSGEETVLKVQGVHAGYGPIRILQGIDLEIRQGEVVGLLGANGAGKTTLARVVGGWCDIYEGTVEFNGLDMHAWAPYKRARHGLAHVLEGRHLIPNQTVIQNLELPLMWRGLDEAERRERIQRIFDMFPRLLERRLQYTGNLSGGEQQMVAVGRALLLEPKVLILDEPSSGLAPLIVQAIFKKIREFNEELNISILLIEQNVKLAVKIVDRAYVLQNGSIGAQGNITTLLSDERVRTMYMGI